MTADSFWYLDDDGWHPLSSLSPSDRGLQYGDGLFETLRFAADGSLPLQHYHQQRLSEGLAALGFHPDLLKRALGGLNRLPQQTSAAKLIITRGAAGRGYMPPQDPGYHIQLQCFNAPAFAALRHPFGLRCEVSPVRLGRQPALAGFKHLNRLEQVLIRQQFPAGCEEVIVCDSDDNVIEACMSNLYFLQHGQWYTPDLSHSGVNGVVRRWLSASGRVQSVSGIGVEQLLQADAVAMSNTLNGIVMVQTVGRHQYDQHPDIAEWQQEFQELFA
tara:strand:- start:21315 stop:22133 length:819 start_codon:yes stop_codon:yes gene_type:complete